MLLVAATVELGYLTDDRDRLLTQRKVSNRQQNPTHTPIFAHTHKGSQRIMWPAANMALRPSSGFTQGDVNSSKLFTCNTASLVQGLQDAAGDDATVVAIVDDITIMGTLEALSLVEQSRALLQKPANYLVNTDKQYVYTMNETHMSEIQRTLPDHTIIYIGGDQGFSLSGIPLGVTTTSYRSYKKTWTRRKKSATFKRS